MGKGVFGQLLCQAELSGKKQSCQQWGISRDRSSEKQRSWEIDGRGISGVGPKIGMCYSKPSKLASLILL